MEVIDDGGGNDRNRAHQGGMAPPLGLELVHHPVGGRQAEGGSSGEHHRLHLLDRHPRLEQGSLARARGRPPELGRDTIGLGEDDDGAPGGGDGVGPVADSHSGDGGEGAVHGVYLRGTRGPMAHTIS